jgi:hypothetical protein
MAMKRKRKKKPWRERQQSGEYSKRKTNYSDRQAINRRPDETESALQEDSSPNIGKKLKCKNCGYERIITLNWLESIGAKRSLDNFEAIRSVFAEYN